MTETRQRQDVGAPDAGSDEKSTLVAFLNRLREAVMTTTQGLDADKARTPGVPSGTSVLGLVKHLTAAEPTGSPGPSTAPTSPTRTSACPGVGLLGTRRRRAVVGRLVQPALTDGDYAVKEAALHAEADPYELPYALLEPLATHLVRVELLLLEYVLYSLSASHDERARRAVEPFLGADAGGLAAAASGTHARGLPKSPGRPTWSAVRDRGCRPDHSVMGRHSASRSTTSRQARCAC